MERLKQLQQWSIYEYGKSFFIEPETRHEVVMEKINDVIDTLVPGVVVKAGLGAGRVLLDLAGNQKEFILIVVEPSLRIIEDFIRDNSGDSRLKKIYFINGDFTEFPVDYYAADLIISIDNLDVQETAPVMDEFRRALQFDAHFFFAGVVLDDDDIDGVFDDFMRIISPLHNDYYLKDDLKTFMNLKDFTFVKGKVDNIENSLDDIENHLTGIFGNIDRDGAERFISENMETLSRIYKMDGRNITLPYFTGVFKRRKK